MNIPSNVGILGVGVIGQSWARLFAEAGSRVVVFDPRPDIAEVAEKFAAQTGLQLEIAADLAELAQGAELIQENGPERVDWKQETFAELGEITGDGVILASSSSAIPASVIAKNVDDAVAARIIIGHPFNPPHEIPLVEVVGGERTSAQTVARAMEIYAAYGKTPIQLKKEIPGFAGNRLQWAIIREMIYLVQEGVIDAPDLDTLIEASLGIRWASVGPFKAFHLGGGDGGLQHIMDHILSTFEESVILGKPDMSPEATKVLCDQVNAAYGLPARPEIAAHRDRVQEGIIELQRGE